MKNSPSFFTRVFAITKEIPQGKIATYGLIAQILDTKDARRVGHALHANRDPLVPCHRVVFRDGSLAPGYAFGGEKEQRFRLEKEGIMFNTDGKVDVIRHLWQPYV